MQLAIIGAGNVGGALGTAWAQKSGHDICFGVRDPKADKAQALLRALGGKVAFEGSVFARIYKEAATWVADIIRQLRQQGQASDDPALLEKGGIDALLRTSDEACAGLHIDRIAVRAGDSGRLPAILVTRPGIAGCRQHRTLVKLLMA